MDASIREHLPQVLAPAPARTPTERQRLEQLGQMLSHQERLWNWRGLESRLTLTKAEDARREREAKAPRVEEVNSDMDVEGGSGSEGEVGVNVEAGKRRKVVRKGRVSTSSCSKGLDVDFLIHALRQLPDTERARCFNAVVKPDFGVGLSCAVSEASEFEGDKAEFNARAATAPTQEDVANTPCG